MKDDDQTKLLVTWCGAFVMTIIFAVMLLVENMNVERKFKENRAKRSTAKVIRMRPRPDTLKFVVAK